jgi:hypothetical protein
MGTEFGGFLFGLLHFPSAWLAAWIFLDSHISEPMPSVLIIVFSVFGQILLLTAIIYFILRWKKFRSQVGQV